MPERIELVDNDGCFACGRANPLGLKLEFAFEADEYVTYFIPGVQHQGWVGITHGGIVSTVLDEVMARCVHELGLPAVTAELVVRLKKPARVGERIRFAGRVVSQNARVIECSARATDQSGVLIAEATERMVRV